MNGEMGRLLERIAQRRQALERELEAARQERAPASGRGRPAPVPGAPVFDTISGQYGEVVGVGSETIVIPVAR